MIRTLSKATLAALVALPLLAQASSLEERWRAFLDKNPKIASALSTSGVPDAPKPVVRQRTDVLPLGTNEYVVFVAPGCRQCNAAVKGVKGSGADVKVMDITRSRTAREAFAATGAKHLPATLIANQLIVGWSRKAYEQAMASAALAPQQGS